MKIFIVLFGIISITYCQSQCVTPNGEQAQCISIYQCKIFIAALKNRTTENDQFMRASQCGYSNNPLVCCGSVAKYQSIATSEQITQMPISNNTNPLFHKNINILAPLNDCGYHGSDHIFLGNILDIDKYPWTVLLEYKNKTSGKSVGHFCGGVLIGPKYILTAAHCVVGYITKKRGDLFRVRLGEYDQSTSPTDCLYELDSNDKSTDIRDCNEPHQDINVEEVIAHPDFNNIHPYHDIAIVRLAKPAEYNDFVKPICMPLNGESKDPGQYLDVAGWGINEADKSSSKKMKGRISVVANEECARIYSKYRVQIYDKQLCAGGTRQEKPCIGDSGGPLMTVLSGKENYYVEGIASFSDRFCYTDIPYVYTRVASYISWILDNMRQ